MAEKLTYRIVTGDPASVEQIVDHLAEEYAPIMLNVQQGKDGPLVTCIMISQREIMKAQVMQARMMGPGRPV